MSSDASYVIEVASSFKGEQTNAQLDALSSKLSEAGAGADDFQNAVVSLSRSLESAAASTTTANKALADGNAEYKLLEQAANQAAKAVEKAAAGSKGVVDLEAYRAATAASQQATAALETHVGSLAKLEAAAKQAAGQEKGLANALANTKKLASAAAAEQSASAALSERNLKKLRSGLAGVGGPLGKLGAAGANAVDDFRDLEESLGTAGARLVTIGALSATAAAAVALVTVAVIAATIAIAAWAIGLADSNRNTALAREASEALHPELVGLRDTFASLTAETGLHANELASYAGQLKEAKVAAADIPAALRAIALSEAALGKGGSADFLKDVKAGKVAVSVLAAEANSKLGGIVKRQMLGLSAQSEKLKANVGQIFGGLNIEPVLLGLQKLVALFDENTAAGAAIKLVFESIFQPLIDHATDAATVVEAFVLGFMIGLTKLYIAAKPVIAAVAEFFGTDDTSLADTVSLVTKAGEYFVPVFLTVVAVFGALALAAGVAVAGILSILAPLFAVGAAVVALGTLLVVGFVKAWGAVSSYLESLSLEGVGAAIMKGLANGIAAAAGLPLEAITAAVSGAIAGAKALLGIHSPSKVFAEIGGYTAEGFSEGVDEGTPAAQSSLASMVSSTSAQAALSGNAGGSAPAAATQGEGVHLHLEGAHLEFHGVKDAPSGLAQLREMLIKIYEEGAGSFGAAEATT